MGSGFSQSLQTSGLEWGNNYFLQSAGIELNQRMLPVFLGLLLAAAVAWIFLSRRLYVQLQQNFPEIYKELGSPRPFLQKSLLTNFKTIGFLFGQAHGIPPDSEIIRLIQGLKAIFCIYLFCLAGSVVLLLARWHAI